MKNYFIIAIFLFHSHFIFGQFYERNDRVAIFTDEANIRETSSVKSKIVVTLKHGIEVIVCNKTHVQDTINGIISSWVPVLYKGNQGFLWGNTLATKTYKHINGNRLLLKNDFKGIVYKVFTGDSLINTGTHLDKPFILYSYFDQVEPLFAVRENMYFKLGHSDLIFSFDGVNVVSAGKCDKENINSLHQAAQKKVLDSITSSIIIADNVNLRDAPNINAKIIGKLSKHIFVNVIEQAKKGEEMAGEYNYWFKINWKGKVGYVWGKSISTPKIQIYDNDDVNTSYLMCNNALIVLFKGKIIASCYIGNRNGEAILSFGDLGFGKGYDFVGIESMAHSCGEWGGDTYYLWDGKKIKYFCSSGGVGDGGLSEGEIYTFPSEHSGIQGKMIKSTYASEMIDIIPVDDCEVTCIDAFDYKYTSIMSYNGDTLVEVPSKYSELKQLVELAYPKFKLVQYEFGDINNDSMEDVIFQVKKESYNIDSDGEENHTFKNKIGVILGKNNGTFEIVAVNEHFIGSKDESRPNILFKDSSLIVTVYSGGIEKDYENKMSGLGRKIYTFIYHSNDKKIYWESLSTLNEKGLKKSTFKTKKILFKDAWSFDFDEVENDN
ncbi:MAG: SH3 domain-containing protein [Bacteroidia bacterium]